MSVIKVLVCDRDKNSDVVKMVNRVATLMLLLITIRMTPLVGFLLLGDLIFDFWCFNVTFSNISVISWRPVLVVEETGVPGENHRPWASN